MPAYADLAVTVDDAVVTDDEVAEQFDALRARFGTLKGVERPVQTGDFVSIDLTASVDGVEVEGGSAQGLSYEVGSGNLIDGLDEAIIGKSAGESAEFASTLGYGEHAGTERRDHRAVQLGQGAGTARGRRRVRPAGLGVRHRRGAAGRPAHPAGPGQGARPGRRGPGQGARAAGRRRPRCRCRSPRCRPRSSGASTTWCTSSGTTTRPSSGTWRPRARPRTSSPPSCARSPRSR